ncbi:hypothetical protein Q5752_006287 [Cryptotrichosporon argae]
MGPARVPARRHACRRPLRARLGPDRVGSDAAAATHGDTYAHPPMRRRQRAEAVSERSAALLASQG